MDLETAHRISLIQRNLEAAQVMIDSAVELLGTIIRGATINTPTNRPAPYAEPGVDSTPVPKRHTRPAKAQPPKAKDVDDGLHHTVNRKTVINHSAVVREFAKHHSGEFNKTDVVRWAKSKGLPINARKLSQALYAVANQGKDVKPVAGTPGVYKKVEIAA